MITTHDPNVLVNVYLDPSPAQEAGFDTVMLIVPQSTNSLNGNRTMTFTSYEDAVTANTAGYISSSTLAAAAAAFAQRPKPAQFKVGYVDLVTSVAAVKASKAFGGAGLGDNFDSVLAAHVAGEDGNSITFELVGDSGGAPTITITGTAVVVHYQPGVTTVGNIETAITALAGASDIIDVKTAGTSGNVLDADAGEMSPVALAGGTDAVPVETYATALPLIIADDPDFYGVCMTSRVQADVAAVALYVESASKKMRLAYQDDDADWLTSGVPAGLSAMEDYDRSIGYWHTTDSVWMDVATLVNRLIFDPDEKSAPWHGHSVRGVAAYTTPPTAAQRLLAIANNINLGLPYGGQDFVIDPGVAMSGRPADEITSADWFSTRLQERTSALVVEHADRGEKINVDKTGQEKILALIDGLLSAGVAAGHFVAGQVEAVAEAITSSDLTARQLRFTVRAQFAVSGRLFTFNCYFSREPIADNG